MKLYKINGKFVVAENVSVAVNIYGMKSTDEIETVELITDDNGCDIYAMQSEFCNPVQNIDEVLRIQSLTADDEPEQKPEPEAIQPFDELEL